MDVVSKVANMDNHYRAIDFYMEYQPMMLNDLLSLLVSKVEHSRVVGQIDSKARAVSRAVLGACVCVC